MSGGHLFQTSCSHLTVLKQTFPCVPRYKPMALISPGPQWAAHQAFLAPLEGKIIYLCVGQVFLLGLADTVHSFVREHLRRHWEMGLLRETEKCVSSPGVPWEPCGVWVLPGSLLALLSVGTWGVLPGSGRGITSPVRNCGTSMTRQYGQEPGGLFTCHGWGQSKGSSIRHPPTPALSSTSGRRTNNF